MFAGSMCCRALIAVAAGRHWLTMPTREWQVPCAGSGAGLTPLCARAAAACLAALMPGASCRSCCWQHPLGMLPQHVSLLCGKGQVVCQRLELVSMGCCGGSMGCCGGGALLFAAGFGCRLCMPTWLNLPSCHARLGCCTSSSFGCVQLLMNEGECL